LSQAIAALSEPGSTVAVLQGSGSAAGARGFAAFPADGGAHVVLVDLPQAPAGQTYQAWYIADGAPTSAGLMAVGSDGYAVLADDEPLPGTEIFAVTLEPAGGSPQPTSDPIIVGELAAPA
jgi:anti-sigma-K factor RskA